MSARASTSNLPPKFTKPFVPPSDSSRSQSFASSPVRTFRDGLPPAKRRRLASTPTSSSVSLSTPRSSSIRPERPTPVDIHDARAASSMRVLNIWASLAERYNRRLDEDDIVDIRTGEIIKDRGVLNELPKRYKFGDLADQDDPINTDPGSEAADNPAEDEEDEDDEEEGEDDEENAEENDAFPSPDALIPSQLAQMAPLKPATSSSDADDLREFLKAEAIRRELDGGDDDESSEDEFNILPPRPTPARRTTTPARAKLRSLESPIPDTESEDEFAVCEVDRDNFYPGYRVLRTPSPEVLASVPSPPPLSSSPGPSSSFSLPSSPLLSRTPLDSNREFRSGERSGSPTPKRQPVASTSSRTIEEALDEIDLEFPPPRPRAPSVFAKRPNSAFIIDLSLSDDESEDERSVSPAKVTKNQKFPPSEPKTAKKATAALIPKRQIPYVLIRTTPPAPARAIHTSAVDSDPPSTRADLGRATSPKKGRPRTRSSKGKPPDPSNSQSTNAKLETRPEGESGGTFSGVPTSSGVDETAVARGTPKAKSPSLSPARSEPVPKVKRRPKPRPKGKSLLTRVEPSSDGNRASSTTKRVISPKPSPKSPMTPKPGSNPKSVRESATKPRSTRSTRSAGSGDSAKTAKPMSKSKVPRKLQEVLSDAEGDDDDRGSPPLPPSPSPAPPIRPRTRSALKRKRRISSGSSSNENEERGNRDSDLQPPSLPGSDTGQARETATPEAASTYPRDSGGNPEAGGSKPRTQSPPGSTKMTEVTPALTPINTTPTVTRSNNGWGEDNTQNRPGGSYTHFPIPPPLPVGFPDQIDQSFTQYPGLPPPFQDYGRCEHGTYPLFQDPNAQAILAQAVTQLAVLMNGGRPPQTDYFGGMRGIPGNMPTTNGFPGSPGWGMFSAFPPSTPTTSRYPHGYPYEQRSFQNPYFAQHQAGPGMGLSTPPPTVFPPSNAFPPSMSQPEQTPAARENGAVQEQASSAARRVTFASDLASSLGDGPSVPEEASRRGTEGSPPTTRRRSRAKSIVKETNWKGDSKVDKDKSGQSSRLDADGSGNEGNVDRHSSPEGRNRVRRRARGGRG